MRAVLLLRHADEAPYFATLGTVAIVLGAVLALTARTVNRLMEGVR